MLLELLLPIFVGLFVSGGTVPVADTKIVGGYETTIEKRPYLVSVELDGEPSCGGVIVDEVTVVTAAHCTNSYVASSVVIRAGSTMFGSGGSTFNVANIIQHPNYISENENNDISILKLSTPLSFNTNVQPAVLSSQSVVTGTPVVVAGWGVTSETSQTPSTTLREVQIEIIDHDLCKNSYSLMREVTDQMICAGDLNGGKDACLGDSGGALVLSSNYALVGIVSWGLGCGRSGYPGVYTDVQSYIEWINGNLG